MTFDRTQSLEAFLAAAAAKQPTPGGGSVAALAGALATAMGEMVVNYSIGKKDLAAHQPELLAGLTKLTHSRQMLVEMMIEDQFAYDALTSAKKLPQTDPNRQTAITDLALKCIVIPQSIGGMALAVLRIVEQIVEKSNRYLLSDLAVCAELSMATIRCAGYNVRVNLPEMSDASSRKAIEQELSRQNDEGVRLIRSAMPRIWKRLEQA